MKFTVLMSLYSKERPDFLEQSLLSLTKSTYPIPEIIIVLDGPVGEENLQVLQRFSDRLPIKTVRIERNVGLGMALNVGLRHCSNEWVARFDTDDLIVEDRFEKQIKSIMDNPKLDILGGWIAEFENNNQEIYGIRRVPTAHSQILKYAQRRNPFNHMTVMYRKSKVLECGGYGNEYLYEDYALWVKMLQNGALTENISDCLVYARAGYSMVNRRGGFKYLKSEFRIQRIFLDRKFISIYRFFLNLMQRLPVRIISGNLRYMIYKIFLRN